MTVWMYHGCRILLGAVFVLAAVMKALDRDAFETTVADLFNLASQETTTTLTIGLMLLEIILGLLLLLNWRIKQTAVVTSLLLIGFLGVQVVLWQQGVACRCFGNLSGSTTGTEMLRNVMLLGVCIALFKAQKALQTKTPKGGEPFGA